MKCRKCRETAVINMAQHKLALCREHYLEWFAQQTERAIHKYSMFPKNARVLAAISGGKDSLALWDVLHKLGYAVDGIYIHLGISDGSYSDESSRLANQFAEQRGLTLINIHLLDEYHISILDMSQRSHYSQQRPCAACGLIKRYIMNRVGVLNGYDVLVTGHNLDDEVAVLLGNTLHWSKELLPRQSPVLQGTDGFIRKAKPLCRFYERETAAYALLEGIEYVYDECPYAVGGTSYEYKEILNRLEEKQPGSKLAFYQSFLNVRADGFFNVEAARPVELKRCVRCGQPTTTETCAFCRLVYEHNGKTTSENEQ